MRRARAIRLLNDNARTTLVGCAVVFSPMVGELPLDIKARIILAVQSFRDFDEGNDPKGHHAFASLRVVGHEIFFRFTYWGDPANPCTLRKLTIMTPDEYPQHV